MSLILWWTLLDARQHGYSVGKMMRIGLILFTFIAFPIYVFQSRGIAGFKLLLLSILFFSAMQICTIAMALISMLLAVQMGYISADVFS